MSIFCLNVVNAEITWSLSEDGTLTISGTGDMENYSMTNMPWYSQRSNIKSVVINNSVTSIGDLAFYGCKNLTSIIISNSVKSIGERAFSTCTSLTSITIPNSVKSIGYSAFYYCM